MLIINMHAAKSQLSDLVKRAQAGEEIVIARDGEPVAKLVPVDADTPAPAFGAYAGMIRVPASFFDELPDDESSGWGV
jgi:prevent-host-death family protein